MKLFQLPENSSPTKELGGGRLWEKPLQALDTIAILAQVDPVGWGGGQVSDPDLALPVDKNDFALIPDQPARGGSGWWVPVHPAGVRSSALTVLKYLCR